MRCRLREVLKEQGRTQTWLADQVGVSKQSMTRIVDKGSTHVEYAVRIAKALEVPVEEIWRVDDEG
jgi:putative transcriptional regulator